MNAERESQTDQFALFFAPTETAVTDSERVHPEALLARRVLLRVDWSGESQVGEIERFVTQRATAFGVSQAKEVIRAAAQGAAEKWEGTERGRGDWVPSLLAGLELTLQPTTVALGEVRDGTDSYVIGLIPRADHAIKTWGLSRPHSTKLFIIPCGECRSTNVWELAEQETAPTEGECDGCGCGLFDESGIARYPVMIEEGK